MKLRFTLFLCLGPSLLFAQIKLSGRVMDNRNQPLPYANVLLLAPSDSTMIAGTVTNNQGGFLMEKITAGSYRLSVRLVGYTSVTLLEDIFVDKKLETIVLTETATTLNEVVVRADKPLFEQQLDKLVVNLKNNVLSAGNTVLDVLERSPGISVDRQSGSLSMNGKQGVQVMINGKLQRLPLNVVVQQLEGHTSAGVEKIELISNPSSRFDAEGDAGIINIVTKQQTDLGTNGTAMVGVGYADLSGLWKPTGSLAINHKRQKLLLTANYSLVRDNRWQQWNYERQLFTPNLYSNTITDRHASWPVQRAGLGLEWNINKTTTINTLVAGFSDYWKMESFNQSRVMLNGRDSARIHLYDREVNHWKHLMGNVNLNHRLANGARLNIDLDYLYYHDHNPNEFTNTYSYSATNQVVEEQVRTGKETPISMGVIKVDYETKWRPLKLELGGKSTFSRLRNTVSLENKVGEAWIADTRFTRNYRLRDDANAVYVNVSGKAGPKGQFQAGLRAESTDMEMTAGGQRLFSLDFLKLFPTVFYTWQATTNSSLQISYNRRITRPAYTSVAPFVIFMDPFTYYWGNLQLKPAISDGVQASYTYKDLLLTLKYSQDRNAIAGNQSRYNSEERKTYIYADNVDQLQLYAFTASWPWKITSWWRTQSNALLTYQKTNHVYAGVPIELNQYSARLSLNQTFTLPEKITLEVSAVYASPITVGLSVRKAAGVVSAGVQKVINDYSKLNLTVTDIFWTRNSIYVSDNPLLGQIQKTSYYNEPRVLRLSYTVTLGNTKMKSAKARTTASEAEQQRVN